MKRIVLSLLALAASVVALANGDPVISYSAFIRSSNPVPLKVSEVQVVREDLSIKLGLPYTEVSVVYQLRNSSLKPIHVDYGFPIDFSGAFGQKEGFDGDEYGESLYEVGIEKRAVRDIHFRLDGRELSWERADEVVTDEGYLDEESGMMVYTNSCRLWTYTVLDIAPGRTVTLEVSYAVLSNWSTGLGTLRGSPLSRYFPTDGDITYDFTPAQHWGNGKAGEISVKVDCSALPEQFFGEDSPSVGYGVRSGKVWTFSQQNFDFAEAGPLSAYFFRDYENPDRDYPSWGDPLRDCAVPTSDYAIEVSGEQAKYPAHNMADGLLATAWVAPGDGVGATIEFYFHEPSRVSDIVLYNGYNKTDALWKANSRIKRMRVDVLRADGFVDSFETNLTDEKDWWQEHSYALYASEKPFFGKPVLISITNIPRMEDGREIGVDPDGMIVFDRVPEDSEMVSRICLTILETVPGTQYKDLCVSEISVLDGFKIL